MTSRTPGGPALAAGPPVYTCECGKRADIYVRPMFQNPSPIPRPSFAACYEHTQRAFEWVQLHSGGTTIMRVDIVVGVTGGTHEIPPTTSRESEPPI